MKLLITFDPETGEPIEFMWNEGRRPPPLVKSKIKKGGGIVKEQGYIRFKIRYEIHKGEKTATISLLNVPDIENLRYGLVGYPKKYTLDEFKKIFPLTMREGRNLDLFIVNQETGEDAKFGYDIFKGCPHNLTELKIKVRELPDDISEHLKKIGLIADA